MNACKVICSMQMYTFRKWQKLREEDHLTYVWKTVFFIKNVDVFYSMNTSIHRDVYRSNYTITKYWYNFMKRRFEKLELYMMYKEEMKSMIGSISFLTNCIYHIGLHVWKIMWLERLLKFSEETWYFDSRSKRVKIK